LIIVDFRFLHYYFIDYFAFDARQQIFLLHYFHISSAFVIAARARERIAISLPAIVSLRYATLRHYCRH
jgi:hypothetical protein